MLRRLAPLLLCLSLACSAVADDLPPWAQPQAPAPAQPAPGSASGPAAEGPSDSAAFGELLALLLSPDDLEKLRQDSEENRAKWLQERWAQLKPHQRAQVTFAAANLREAKSVASPRSLALLVLGPPQQMYSEPARAWSGEQVERIDDLKVLHGRLRGEKAGAEAGMLTLTGELPTELWVYPGKSVTEVRVVRFVDEDRDGTFRYAGETIVAAGQPVSTAPAVEPPGDVFPPVAAGGTVAELPALVKPGLPVKASQDFFKAAAGRTFTRFLIVVDPDDVDVELSADPAEFATSGEAFVRLEKDGVAAWQGSVKLADTGATATTPWLAEISVPLEPGAYDATALVKDDGGAGGTAKWQLDVPAYGGKIALSSPVVARVGPDGQLPKAASAADGSQLMPFQIGNYLVRPVPGATFKRGESAAFVVQVYDAPSATIEYDLYFDGQYQNSLEPTDIKALPATQINIQDIGPKHPDGSYELRVTVKNAKDPSQTATVKIPFRVRG